MTYYVLHLCYWSYQNGTPEVSITIYDNKIEAEEACINNRKKWYEEWPQLLDPADDLDDISDEEDVERKKAAFLDPYNPNGSITRDNISWIETLPADALDKFPITFRVQASAESCY